MAREDLNFDFDTSETVKELQVLKKGLESAKKQYIREMQEIQKISAKYSEMIQKDNPYRAALEEAQRQQEEMITDIGKYDNLYQKRIATDKWYLKEFEKVVKDINKLSEEEQFQVFIDLDNLYSQKKSQNHQELLNKYGKDIGGIVGDGLSDILTDYKNFNSTLKTLTKQLYKYLIDQSMQWMTAQVNLSKWISKAMNSIGSGIETGSSFLEFGKKFNLWGKIKGLFGFGKKFHNGGVVPVGANTELPGTKEQLALLKGGERILSPGENASYNSSQQGSSPVVLNNFNIKAWDSKDVKRYLLENRELLNQITYEGIKNNNAHLRHIVRNA